MLKLMQWQLINSFIHSFWRLIYTNVTSNELYNLQLIIVYANKCL